jgi:hypothetical protein
MQIEASEEERGVGISFYNLLFYTSGSQSVGLAPLGGHKRSSKGGAQDVRNYFIHYK